MKHDLELDPDHCSLYRAGHTYDLAEGKLVWRYGPRPISVRIVEVHKDGVFVVMDDEERVYRLWNHDPTRISSIADYRDSLVAISPLSGVLRARDSIGWHAISVCDGSELTECDPFAASLEEDGYSVTYSLRQTV